MFFEILFLYCILKFNVIKITETPLGGVAIWWMHQTHNLAKASSILATPITICYWMKITLLLLLLIFPAFFAASELSFLLIRPSKVLRLIEEKRKGAFSILKIQKRFRSSLIASQFGVTISLIAIGWLSKGLANDFWNENIF